ncbi:MAG: VOC family protein [Acidobacteriota bacterium]
MTESFRVDGLDHVELFVPSRREAGAWYQRVLGLTPIPEALFFLEREADPLLISSDEGRTSLAIFRADGPGRQPREDRPTAGFHRVAFRVSGNSFLRFLERLPELELRGEDGAVVTATAAMDHDIAVSIYFLDPWGHRLEVTTYDREPVLSALGRPAGHP